MEFASLREFKDAILEHFVLNGREVKFVKNDKVRVKLRCKQACEFLALVSKVGGSSTYRMKTLVPTHTCGRVFNNKNAKSKW
ncbi:Transposase, MuDR, plant [Sesbania bispinosa]|nr:Transposase, MuDR, plant [Sesbania bispinosa]